MTAPEQQSVFPFEKMPEELARDVLKRCSPSAEINAAASCKGIRTFIAARNKQLVPHFMKVTESTKEPLCPRNTGKLYLRLQNSGSYGYDATLPYKALQSCIDTTKSYCIAHLSDVHGLGITHITGSSLGSGPVKQNEADAVCSAQQCLLHLFQMLPNLKTLWVGSAFTLKALLDCTGLHASPYICRASLMLTPSAMQLHSLPALLPNLDTLCLTTTQRLAATYLQPLSQLSQLKYFSLHTTESGRWPDDTDEYEEEEDSEEEGYDRAKQYGKKKDQDLPSSLPELHHIHSLRHLQLQGARMDMRGLAGMSQLTSLSLANMTIVHPEALSQLNLTSLTLVSAKLDKQARQEVTAKHRPTGPHWPKLKRLYLSGDVWESLLQQMLLPLPAAPGFKVRVGPKAFNSFHIEYAQVLDVQRFHQEQGITPWYASLTYLADAKPLLGPAYLAVSDVTSLQVQGEFAPDAIEQLQATDVPLQNLYIVCWSKDNVKLRAGCQFPFLKQLGLVGPSLYSDGWYNWLSKCPLLTEAMSDFVEADEERAWPTEYIRRAADRFGISVQYEVAIETGGEDSGYHVRRVLLMRGQKT